MKKCDFENFIKEVNPIFEKYNIRINGCGCCGSPWLETIPRTNLDKTEYIVDDIHLPMCNDELNKYINNKFFGNNLED